MAVSQKTVESLGKLACTAAGAETVAELTGIGVGAAAGIANVIGTAVVAAAPIVAPIAIGVGAIGLIAKLLED
ncbi:MAG: hypothetical protein HFH82_16540 [Lachnospiraceae bacterium]|nr:hypothetical protein [Lachnospiraceae bacterium]